jgi:hypothetical protein
MRNGEYERLAYTDLGPDPRFDTTRDVTGQQ